MGRGLAAILSVAPRDEAEELRELAIELVVPNPHQPRTSFDEPSRTLTIAHDGREAVRGDLGSP